MHFRSVGVLLITFEFADYSRSPANTKAVLGGLGSCGFVSLESLIV